MTQEEQYEVVKDLGARHGVKIQTPRGVYTVDAVSHEGFLSIQNTDGSLNDLTPHDGHYWLPVSDDFKPYLRPMSSITENEIQKIRDILNSGQVGRVIGQRDFEMRSGILWFTNMAEYDCVSVSMMNTVIDCLDRYMLDHRGLIDRGLALEALEGMYEATI